MAIIVDKIQKRKDIALSCKKLFVNKSISELTIAQVAQTAGVGKGTIYEYFNNKEEIVFEVLNLLMQEYNILKEQRIQKAPSSKEKIKVFFHFFYEKEENDLRKLYKEFISISLSKPQAQMIQFQSECSEKYFQWFRSIIQEGIDKGELTRDAIHLARGLFVLGEGMFISSEVTNTIADVEKELAIFLDTLFELIEVKR
ncbi:MAG: TetR/AcrR family transcriptional regulator [Sulfurimonas sp.]|nr:TetR/AcrR family transcriptional regulator [Sulfurimonas sp.]